MTLKSCLVSLLLLAALTASASTLTLSARKLAAPGWQASGVSLYYAPPDVVEVRIASITLPGGKSLRDLQLSCRQLEDGQGLRCPDAPFSFTLPGVGKISGKLRAHYRSAELWTAEVEIPKRGLRASLVQNAAALKVSLDLKKAPAADLIQLAATVGGLKNLGEASGGTLDAELEIQLDKNLTVHGDVRTSTLTYADSSGSYATDKLSAQAEIHWQSASKQAAIKLRSKSGQAYVDPVFFDFDAHALEADIALKGAADGGWTISRAIAKQANAGTLKITGSVGKDYKPQSLDIDVDAQDLGPLVTTGVQPFLIGGKLEGLNAAGSGRITARLRKGAPESFSASLRDASISAEKLGIALDGMEGEIHWGQQPGKSSRLRWSGGTLMEIPLQASAISFKTSGQDFELLSAWRQPLLEGALKVDKMSLRNWGGKEPRADFEAELEPLDLAALCRALGWPVFGGKLSGRLPGLTVRDDIWSMNGVLEAQAFDGRLRIANLRAISPLGALPRVTADIEIRHLDLEAVTSAFSFGRITGRLDGDVTGLRLVRWSPIAFDGRIYSTPGDTAPKRISQRAIDNISSIGGGPTGVVSRGFLRIFEDFAYANLGLRCVLMDDVCYMDGIEPAKSKDGRKAYYIVKGRLLPRIDVVGYAERVSWRSLIAQLKAAQASGGPQLGGGDSPKPAKDP